MAEKTWYPTFEQYRELARFHRKFAIEFDREGGTFKAIEQGYEHITFEAALNRDGIRQVLTVDREQTEVSISDKDFRVINLDDFGWKLFCLLKKRGKI